ncbi:MAG: DUF4271 domain-containing protein, partial [Muribaculaceae bacterium]|nr:DUF4271 domain-containing protein [Muribaculaceae bacterium]
ALVCAALDAKGIARTLAVYRNALWSVRRRRNAFDESHISSLPAQIILAAVFVIFGGVTLYNLPALPSPSVFSGAAKAMGLLGAYYIFQLIIYNLTGYAFSDSTGRKQWVQGFAAAQAIAGLGLIVPALLLVEMPQWHNVLIILALAIYFATRIIFIAKGFRIFYRNSWSVLYFILYLCSLEIIPPVGIYFFMKNILSGT